MPSNIRTYVQWKDSSVFAGEDIECIITFKNIARTAQQRERDVAEGKQGSRFDTLRPILERQRTVTQSTAFTKPSFARLPSIASGTTAPSGRGHRPTISMTVAPNTPQTGWSSNTSTGPGRPAKAHGRSLSILSLGTDAGGSPARNTNVAQTRRGVHGRSASLQFVPRSTGQTSPSAVRPTGRQYEISDDAATPPLESEELHIPHGGRKRPGISSAPTTPAVEQTSRSRSGTTSAGFRFPPSEPLKEDPEDIENEAGEALEAREARETDARASVSLKDQSNGERRPSQLVSPISPGNVTGLAISSLNPMARVLSEASVNGTPRTSSEFYSMSNVSDETVYSEMPLQAATKLMPRQSLSRSNSRRVNSRPDEPEHLMMGYAQTMGSFSLDGSLVNQAPFEEVKRKGIIGSHGGGGVIGVEQSKRQSGLFGGFGWNNLGESLTGLLGMDEMSSMREMKSTANTKTVPMLSTPQSILFVDLRLAPGQSRSYSYKFKIPKGLPPSHKGRSIKVVYHLRIAVQRSGSVESQKVKDVEIPFRVLGSVNRDGDVLGHDLMSPYILLHDAAKTAAVPEHADLSTFFGTETSSDQHTPPAAGMDDFLRYTERLMMEQPAGAPLVSPSAATERRFSTDIPQAKNMKERIDYAIMRSNQNPHTPDEKPTLSSNRFTIARAGQHVGVLTILRPAYRLGESVLIKIDFCPPGRSTQSGGSDSAPPQHQNTYTVAVSLETSERVDPSLALRSATSINRVTRKVYASATETVLFASQAAFNLEIPPTATPTFETTGVRLQWRIRVGFTTSVLDVAPVKKGTNKRPDDDDDHDADDLDDEKGEGLGILNASDERELDASSPADRSQSKDGKEVRNGEVDSVDDATDEDWLAADGLLENVSTDDRGSILVAREKLQAETFEVGVPIRVFGVTGSEGGGGAGISEVLEI
ncbi:RAB6A-GEF complex partner protein 2 [Sphaceloma murrayae]|uniref:RAB6A-GEF complex partner protein 2 n=1 Tax=Sphaceloma murrayae TaxID=2082308 RepID=A0A2K1QNN2_9PEZI|nr:RAB6A-GEF complex partner protein 2 [Sphaceloma murrayae]